MLCVSIDVSADNFHVAIYYPNSELFKLSSFSQSRNGFDDFKSILLNLDDEIYIALEAAGSYSHNLFSQKPQFQYYPSSSLCSQKHSQGFFQI